MNASNAVERMTPIARRHGWTSTFDVRGRAALASVLLAVGLGAVPAFATEPAAARVETSQADSVPAPGRASFGHLIASAATKYVADWVVDSSDNHGMPFAIVDKSNAEVFVFDRNGKTLGTAPVLLGAATGDDSVPGIGERKLSTIRPEERTTPAGRFVVSLGENLHGDAILWIDYESAISLHRVIAGNPKERRAQRLAGRHAQDRRISFGCINVPVDFFDRVVGPAFTGTDGIVYVLPETRSLGQVFASYDVGSKARPDTEGSRR